MFPSARTPALPAALLTPVLTPVLTVLLALVVGVTGAAPAGAFDGQIPQGDVRRAVFVGNNWEGTVDLLKPGTFERIGRVDMIPDQAARMAEIMTNPERLAFYLAIREAIGEGHDQLVDDMYPPTTAGC